MRRHAATPGGSWRRPRLGLVVATLTLLGCGGGGGGSGRTEIPGVPTLTPNSADLTVDIEALARSVMLVDRTFSTTHCAFVEGSIATSGRRRLLIFETRAVNLGALDVLIGNPASPVSPLVATDFHYHDCHGHYHLEGWASYDLLLDGIPVAAGSKQGFCLLDNARVHPFAAQRASFNCAFQGLSSGYADIYDRNLDGQWVDVTDVPAGDYMLRVTINATGRVFEADDVHPNTVLVPVTLPPPSTPAVPFDDDHGNSIATSTLLAFPIGVVCAIERSGDLDVFRLDVQSGVAYQLAVELQGLADSALRVLAGTGATLASNDNVAPGDPSSSITFTAHYTGPVYLEVRGVLGSTGFYRLVAGLAP